MVRTVLLPTTSPRPTVDASAARLQPWRAGHPSAPAPRSLTLCVDPRRPPRPRSPTIPDGAVHARQRTVRRRRRAVSRRRRPLTRPLPCPDGLVHAHDGERPSDFRAPSSGPRSVVVERDAPSSPLPLTVHTFPHCGALSCGYRPQRATASAHHCCEPHSYTACGWSCPQSSTGFLWVFTSAECGRRRSTTEAYLARQIPTRSWFSPRNLWTGQLVHTLWTASPRPVCAQFCGQLWMKVLSVWTGHPRSVEDVWGQIARPQGLRLSHTGRTGSSTRISAR